MACKYDLDMSEQIMISLFSLLLSLNVQLADELSEAVSPVDLNGVSVCFESVCQLSVP